MSERAKWHCTGRTWSRAVMLLAVCGWAVGSAWGQHPVVQQATAVPIEGPGTSLGPPNCDVDDRCDPNDPNGNILELVPVDPNTLEPIEGCVHRGDTLTIALRQRNLRQPVVGYQAFLCYDPTCLSITPADIEFTDQPYGLPLFLFVDQAAGTIDIAAGITPGDDPTGDTAIVALLHFTANATHDCSSQVVFRVSQPPTRFSDPDGAAVRPCLRQSGRLCVDDTPPVITCPPDVTVECDQPTDPNATGRATATDNCSDPNDIAITYEDQFIPDPNCANAGVIVRTWTATDCSGNSSSCDQTIAIVDTTPPEITCPDDVTVECDQPTDPNATGFATAGDNCTDPNDIIITWQDTVVPGDCPQAFTILREWWADDGCGNMSHCVQTITVVDTTPPEITCPPDVEIECDEFVDVPDPNVAGHATATDNCDDPNNIIIEWQDRVTPDPNCPQGFTVERTWTAMDKCGNSSSCVQSIRVVDTTPPEITCPPDMTVECDEPTDPNHTGRPTATDNCADPNEIVFEPNDVIIPGDCPQSWTIQRHWKAIDPCGNASRCVQTITVVDTTPPVITCPPDVTVECDKPTDPNVTGRPTATDNCADPNEITFTYEDEFTPDPNCPNAGTIRRTWTATDPCGNSSDPCVQTITIVDTTPPVITCPDNTTVECDQPTDPNHTGRATARDNCTDPNAIAITWQDTIVPGDCPQSFVILREWWADDGCGNTDHCVQRIEVQDTTAPTITCPPDMTVECDQPTDPDHTGRASATDNCADPNDIVITFEDRFTPDSNCPNGGVIVRTWTATDPCGNSSSCDQTITVVDTTAPVITCPPDLIVDPNDPSSGVECDQPTDPDHTGFATATDNCTDPNRIVITWQDTIEPGDCTPPKKIRYTILREWQADDGCGNTSHCVQRIEVADRTPPEFVGDCPDVKLVPDAGSCEAFLKFRPTVVDNCDPNVAVMAVRSDGREITDPFPTGLTTVTWIATDDCGNEEQCVQTVQVADFNLMDLRIQIGVEWEDMPDVPSCARCIHLEMFNGSTLVDSQDQVIIFNAVRGQDHSEALVTLAVPCGQPITCITAQDQLHTLRSTSDVSTLQDPNTNLVVYTAAFVGPRPDPGQPFPAERGHWLVPGNFSGPLLDPNDAFVDILDFGAWFSQGGDPNNAMSYDTGDTDCDANAPHGDCDCDGRTSDWLDEVFVCFVLNALSGNEAPCDGARSGRREPVVDISVEELYRRGWSFMASADINRDGRLNFEDVIEFLNRTGRADEIDPQVIERLRAAVPRHR